MKTADPGTPALSLRAVSKRFGPVTALDGLDLEIARGRAVALLGPSVTRRLIAEFARYARLRLSTVGTGAAS
jgi:ABC-type Fe3+/spermidine/putrescine transport system ATPase subunit